MTVAAMTVNRKMLDATSPVAGQCTATVAVLVQQTRFSKSSVKAARRKLKESGLWIAERGVYVPVPIEDAPIDVTRASSVGSPVPVGDSVSESKREAA
jgi:hypothetical protein